MDKPKKDKDERILCLGCGGNITPTLFPGFLCQGCRESCGRKMRRIEQMNESKVDRLRRIIST